MNKVHHHCNFTTPAREHKLAKDAGFTEIRTIGRLYGSVRIFYKLGNTIGDFYKKKISKLSKQKFNSFYKLFAGHLIVIGKKL